METTIKFAAELKKEIQMNFNSYLNTIIDTLVVNEKSYLSAAFVMHFCEYPKIQFDLKSAINRLLDAQKDEEALWFKDNKVFIRIFNSQIIEQEESFRYAEKLREVEDQMTQSYFQIEEKQNIFNNLEKLDIFEDVIVRKDQIKKSLYRRNPIINATNWAKCCFNTFKQFFNEFTYNKLLSKKGDVTFTKRIEDNIMLALQYSEHLLKLDTKYGKLETPDVQLIVLIGGNNMEKYKLSDFEIIELGSAANYFFDPPVPLPGRIIAKKTYTKIRDGVYDVKSLVKTQEIDSNYIRFYNDCPFEDEIKFQLFYYLDVYSYFSKIYLEFIESNIRRIAKKTP